MTNAMLPQNVNVKIGIAWFNDRNWFSIPSPR